jgi:hypothetical protein
MPQASQLAAFDFGAHEVFVYPGVAIKPEQAQEIIGRTLRDFRIQAHELNGIRHYHCTFTRYLRFRSSAKNS